MPMDPIDPDDYPLTGKDDDADKIGSFVNDLGTLWAGDANALKVASWADLKGKKDAAAVSQHLDDSHDKDTSVFTPVSLKWMKPKPTKQDIDRAWMVARVEEYRYLKANMPQTNAPWPRFAEAPPGKRQTADVPAAIKQGGSTQITPGLVDFLVALNKSFGKFKAGNYAGHTTGRFKDQGMSVDIDLSEVAKRTPYGFWEPAVAVKFLKAVDDLAVGDFKDTHWIALYNDFDVASALKGKVKNGAVRFRGDGNNYHGPSPLKLHIHLEVVVPDDKDAPA